jgi:hypothetical protein
MRNRPTSELLESTSHLLVVTLAEAVLWWTRGPLPDHDRPVVAFARTVALGAGAVIVLAAVAGLLAHAAGMPRIARAAWRCTLPSLRGAAVGAAGTGLALTLALSSPASAEEPRPEPTEMPRLARLPDADAGPRLRRLPDQPAPEPAAPAAPAAEPPSAEPPVAADPPSDAPPPAPEEPAVVAPPPSAEAPRARPSAAPHEPADAPTAPPSERGAPRQPDAQPQPQPPAAGTVVIAPGDSFWRIAEREASARLGHRASEDEIGALWVQLVALNADRLPVRGNPDLLFPGLTVAVPPA